MRLVIAPPSGCLYWAAALRYGLRGVGGQGEGSTVLGELCRHD